MTNSSTPHDAQKMLEGLRENLAHHDKPIAFLFGAGASCSVQIVDPNDENEKRSLIPTVEMLTNMCEQSVEQLNDNKKYLNAWRRIREHIKNEGRTANVENMLSQLRMMLEAVGSKDTLFGLCKDEIKLLEKTVREKIADVVSPKLEEMHRDYPHRKFARWLLKTSRASPVEIFTVNYDILIEYALETERIPVFDGFVGCHMPFFHAESVRKKELAPGVNWVRLWKMHGSVTWQRIETKGRVRIVRGAPNSNGHMIYPSLEKYRESRQFPYPALTDRLTRFLEQDDALLIVVGFSFGDQHINELLFGALENRPRTHIIALQYKALSEEDELVTRALKRPNLIVCGPERGVIGGQLARWIFGEDSGFRDIAFEFTCCDSSEKKKEVMGVADRMGRLTIGDFQSFCDFLHSMTMVV